MKIAAQFSEGEFFYSSQYCALTVQSQEFIATFTGKDAMSDDLIRPFQQESATDF